MSFQGVLVSTVNCAHWIGEAVLPAHSAGLFDRDEAARDARIGDEDAVEVLPRTGRVRGGDLEAVRHCPAHDPLLD